MDKITLDQFLAQLRTLETEWHLDDEGRIRTRIGARICCPVTALGSEKLMYRYRLDAERIGLPYGIAIDVAYAADNRPSSYGSDVGRELRQDLLRATVSKPSRDEYRNRLTQGHIRIMTDLKVYLRLWGGTLLNESTGTVQTPYGDVVDVLVSKWGVL